LAVRHFFVAPAREIGLSRDARSEAAIQRVVPNIEFPGRGRVHRRDGRAGTPQFRGRSASSFWPLKAGCPCPQKTVFGDNNPAPVDFFPAVKNALGLRTFDAQPRRDARLIFYFYQKKLPADKAAFYWA